MAKVGKRVGPSLYLHVSALQSLPEPVQEQVWKAQSLTSTQDSNSYNIIKLSLSNGKISLLSYPGFFEEPFPALAVSISVELESGSVQRKDYSHSENPPILHRKELFLPSGHPRRDEFATLTEALCRAGLLQDAHKVGHRAQWERRLADAGFRVEGHALRRINKAGETRARAGQEAVKRHKTAITRYVLSVPMKALARHGLLDGSCLVFDYGCGKGDDLKLLKANGIPAAGWDPHYHPNAPKVPADIVNLGFVINVIENPTERIEALQSAFSLSRKILVVSAMLTGQGNPANAMPYGDGVRTRKGTFQKYFAQPELKSFIESVLREEAIAVGPGLFYVFRDKLEEQRFLAGRQRTRMGVAAIRGEIPVYGRTPKERATDVYREHRELLDRLRESCIELGREPHPDELPSELITEIQRRFGSAKRAMKVLWIVHDREELEAVRKCRINDLSVYFALNIFNGRTRYQTLPSELQRDVRAFFGSYKNAQATATELLFSAGKPEVIADACRGAADAGFGFLEDGHSLQLHSSLVERLPPVLRAYVGCAARLYGDIDSADLVKIHIQSGKLSLLLFDDFLGKALPELRTRIKINMRKQDIEFFEYGEDHQPQLLYLKSRYMANDQQGFDEQLNFDRQLLSLGLFDFRGFGPSPEEFYGALHANGFRIDGFRLLRYE